MVRHNNVIPNQHFKKQWDVRPRPWCCPAPPACQPQPAHAACTPLSWLWRGSWRLQHCADPALRCAHFVRLSSYRRPACAPGSRSLRARSAAAKVRSERVARGCARRLEAVTLTWSPPSAARAAKAKAVFPRPTAGALRPVVRSQTKRYNTKIRAGRGFTLAELKEAGLPAKYAQTIGICVDHRRKNRSVEGMTVRCALAGHQAPLGLSPPPVQENVKRLQAYKANLVVFPRRARKTKVRAPGLAAPCCVAHLWHLQNGDASAEELKAATQLTSELQPIRKAAPVIASVAVTAEMKANKAYATLRLERMNARMVGIRAKKAAEAEKEKEAAAKA